jgi:hypothetical protein
MIQAVTMMSVARVGRFALGPSPCVTLLPIR